MHRNSTEAVRQGRLQPFKGTGHFPSDSPTDNQLDIGASVADTKTGGSACPGALVAAGKDFASFFMRSWLTGVAGQVTSFQFQIEAERRDSSGVVEFCAHRHDNLGN